MVTMFKYCSLKIGDIKMLKFHRLYSLSFICIIGLFLTGCWSSDSFEKNSKPELVIINVLDKAEFDDCHITGSINITFDEFESRIKLLHKKNHYVIYCADYMCMSSGFCAQLLQDAGFENVWAYEGGMAEWYQKGYPFEGLAESEYLRSENENLADEDHEVIVPVITAEQLQEKIAQFSQGM